MSTLFNGEVFTPANGQPAVVIPSPARNSETQAAAGDVRTVKDIEQDLDALSALSQTLLESPYHIDALNCHVAEDFKLSVVIPVYNEQATVYQVLGQVCAIPVRKEIIVVDDCSTDNTREMLQDIADVNGMRVILQETNQGKGAALRTGFAAATGDVIIVQDADLEYSPADIPGVIEPLIKRECDVVYGSRFLGEEHHDKSWVHRLGNAILTKSSNFTTGLKLTDMETCYKAFRREALEGIEIEQNRFGFEPEITAKLANRHVRIQEVPIHYNARTYEEGKKIGIKDLFNAFYCIAKYGFRGE